MEEYSPSRRKTPLSPEGEVRLLAAQDVHAAIWFYCCEGHSRIFHILPDRTMLEFRLPRVEQMLDFTEGIVRHDGQRYVRVFLPSVRTKTVDGVEETAAYLVCDAPFEE